MFHHSGLWLVLSRIRKSHAHASVSVGLLTGGFVILVEIIHDLVVIRLVGRGVAARDLFGISFDAHQTSELLVGLVVTKVGGLPVVV